VKAYLPVRCLSIDTCCKLDTCYNHQTAESEWSTSKYLLCKLWTFLTAGLVNCILLYILLLQSCCL